MVLWCRTVRTVKTIFTHGAVVTDSKNSKNDFHTCCDAGQ